MNTEISIADFVVHLHPDTGPDCKGMIEKGLRAQNGVISVHFNEADHPHAMIVAYNPEAVSSDTLLAEIRKCDSEAVLASL